MPIYEYQCTHCGQELEKLQKVSDAPLRDCPNCGQSALSKKISRAGFRLKGQGWYETDFKKEGKRNLASDVKAEGQETKKTDSASESTSTPKKTSESE